jgi:hypothetical protein
MEPQSLKHAPVLWRVFGAGATVDEYHDGTALASNAQMPPM